MRISRLTMGFSLRAPASIFLGCEYETLLNRLLDLLERSLNCLQLDVKDQRIPLLDIDFGRIAFTEPLLPEQSVRFANASFSFVALHRFAVHFLADNKPDQWQPGSAFCLTFKNE